MIDIKTREIVPDENVIFYGGFLYIISRIEIFEKGQYYTKTNYKLDVKCLCEEYDDPISLKDIREKYPFVCKVLYDSWTAGAIYNYCNHNFDNDEMKWEKYGTTLGFV